MVRERENRNRGRKGGSREFARGMWNSRVVAVVGKEIEIEVFFPSTWSNLLFLQSLARFLPPSSSHSLPSVPVVELSSDSKSSTHPYNTLLYPTGTSLSPILPHLLFPKESESSGSIELRERIVEGGNRSSR